MGLCNIEVAEHAHGMQFGVGCIEFHVACSSPGHGRYIARRVPRWWSESTCQPPPRHIPRMPSLTIERYALGKTAMIQIGNMASGGTEDLYETI